MISKVWCVFEVVDYEGPYLLGIAQTVDGVERIKASEQKERDDYSAERGWISHKIEFDVVEWEVQP